MTNRDRYRLPTEFYPPIGEQETLQLQHKNVGNPVAPDHTLSHSAYPDRRNRSIIRPSDRPQPWTQYVNGGRRLMTAYKVPTGKVFTSPVGSIPQGQDQFTLSRRIYIYGGQVVTE